MLGAGVGLGCGSAADSSSAAQWSAPRLACVSQDRRTTTILEERTDYRVDEGDHERFSHYVPKDKLVEAMVMGTPVVALCGKVWVPSRNPEKFPVCPDCLNVWEQLRDDEE